MSILTICSSILVCLVIRVVLCATPNHVKSILQIQTPSSLFKAGGYDHREALFGNPPYGGSINQTLYYADSDLCNHPVDNRKGYPTRPKHASGKQQPWPSPFILMIDRGGCTFVKKVRNAQAAGATAVIIHNNVCLCSDTSCVNLERIGSQESCEINEPILADDGSGSDVYIPTFLIMEQDGNALKKVLIDFDQKVQVVMQWPIPASDNRVEYELWTTPAESMSKEFQRNWGGVAISFGNRVYFTPREYVYDGKSTNCYDGNQNMCYSLCTNNGRYCARDPDDDLNTGISGADVVHESLRRICIWKIYGATDGIGAKYWNYVSEFLERCDSVDEFSNLNCTNDIMNHTNINADIVDQCMKDSGGTTGDNTNALLEMEIEAQRRNGVVMIPSVYVNSILLRGKLSVTNAFNAICAGFVLRTGPDVCYPSQYPSNHPSAKQTHMPELSVEPTETSSNRTTKGPSETPSDWPTLAPFVTSSNRPTMGPSDIKSNWPTIAPSKTQSNAKKHDNLIQIRAGIIGALIGSAITSIVCIAYNRFLRTSLPRSYGNLPTTDDVEVKFTQWNGKSLTSHNID